MAFANTCAVTQDRHPRVQERGVKRLQQGGVGRSIAFPESGGHPVGLDGGQVQCVRINPLWTWLYCTRVSCNWKDCELIMPSVA